MPSDARWMELKPSPSMKLRTAMKNHNLEGKEGVIIISEEEDIEDEKLAAEKQKKIQDQQHCFAVYKV